MKVFYDYQAFTMQKYGGISRYFANLYYKAEIDCELGLLYNKNHYLDKNDFALNNILWGKVLNKESRYKKWNKWYCKYLVEKGNFDILHPTYYHPYFLDYLKKPYVLTVHDMIHELFPEFFLPFDPYAQYKRVTIQKADHLIAISDSTKNDLQRIYNIPDEKITVIHHGYYETAYQLSENKANIEDDYILFVGDRAGYKNFFRFLSAIERVFQKYKDIILICMGGGPFNLTEQEFIIRKKMNSKIKQVNVNDNELSQFYKNALLFVYPSLYEGFGLPILEAFDNDCPIAASNTSCFPEVGGDAVIYFDPYEEEDISRAIELIISDTTLASSLRSKGVEQLKGFTIGNCISKTMLVYTNLINK